MTSVCSPRHRPITRRCSGMRSASASPLWARRGGNGTLTLVIPQTPRRLADNYETFAGGWAVTSSAAT